jgi:hypothetical protein
MSTHIFELEDMSLLFHEPEDMDKMIIDYFRKNVKDLLFPRGLNNPIEFLPGYVKDLHNERERLYTRRDSRQMGSLVENELKQQANDHMCEINCKRDAAGLCPLQPTWKRNSVHRNVLRPMFDIVIKTWDNIAAQDTEDIPTYQLRKMAEMVHKNIQLESYSTETRLPVYEEVIDLLDTVIVRYANMRDRYRVTDRILYDDKRPPLYATNIEKKYYDFHTAACSWGLPINILKHLANFLLQIIDRHKDLLVGAFNHITKVTSMTNWDKFETKLLEEVERNYTHPKDRQFFRGYINGVMYNIYAYAAKKAVNQLKKYTEYADFFYNIAPTKKNADGVDTYIQFYESYEKWLLDMSTLLGLDKRSDPLHGDLMHGGELTYLAHQSREMEYFLNKTQLAKMLCFRLFKNYVDKKKIAGMVDCLFEKINVSNTNELVNAVLKLPVETPNKQELIDCLTEMLNELEYAVYLLCMGTIDVTNMSAIERAKYQRHLYEIRKPDIKRNIRARIDKYINGVPSPFDTYFNQKYKVSAPIDQNMIDLMKSTGLTSADYNKGSDHLCSRMLYCYNDTPEKYNLMISPYKNVKSQEFSNPPISYYLDPNAKHIDLQFAHPKYCHKMLHGESYENIVTKIVSERGANVHDYGLHPYQKQLIIGMAMSGKQYFRQLRDVFSIGFTSSYIDLNNEISKKLPPFYTHSFNSEFIQCALFRETLFSVRQFDDFRLPFQAYTDYPGEHKKVERFFRKMNDLIYCGIIRKTIAERDKSRNMFFALFYNTDMDVFKVYDTEMVNLIGSIKSNVVITFTEVQQLAEYGKSYAYIPTDETDSSIFFSRYNIFNPNEKYNPKIYYPLTLREFEECLDFYRKHLKPGRYLKYPNIAYIPPCVGEDGLDQIRKRYAELVALSEQSKVEAQMNLLKYDVNDGKVRCKLTKHNYISDALKR